MSIQVLDQNTINKIAAGEVVERPASIVKELVENAIDAKATAITVEIKDGGISFVRITDNGCGIDKSELPLAFLRHSTSKIKSIEDLAIVSSLGFRGEALSSIAAIAQVELITKTKESFSGSRYVIEGGQEVSLEEVGAPEGTTFIIRNMFYNTPVRRKFLKSPTTEAGYVNALIEHLALSHPDVSFRFINNSQNKLHTSGNLNLRDIIYHVYGREISANLLDVNGKTQDIEIEGFIGKPSISRGNRSYENYYINGRYIKSSVISKAIEEAYKGFIMMHKYPFTAMHFKINPEIIDVNVHPTKMELRFSQNEFVYEFVLNSVRNALTKRELIPNVEFDSKRTTTVKEYVRPIATAVQHPLPVGDFDMPRNDSTQFKKPVCNSYVQTKINQTPSQIPNQTTDKSAEEMKKLIIGQASQVGQADPTSQVGQADQAGQNSLKEAAPSDTNLTTDTKSADTQANPMPRTVHKSTERLPEPFEIKRGEALLLEDNAASVYGNKPEQMKLFSEEKLLDKRNKNCIKVIGQLFDTYWMLEFEDKLFIMDQHAAHEKVLFEKTMKLLKEKTMDTQMLNPPIILSLNMREEEILNEHMEVFTNLGYEIEEFGGKEYKIIGIPASLPSIDDKGLLIEMLDGLVDDNLGRNPELIIEKIASMSCKAAVKGNSRLSALEAQALLDELLDAENPYHCPHGRPTLISMTKYELEKKFKRII